MKKINYWEIIKKSWEISWKNKYLWWFGFFIAISGGGGMNLSFPGGGDDMSTAKKQQMMHWIEQNISIIVIIGLILLLIFVLLLILNIISRGALISSIEKRIKCEMVTFRSAWKEGKKNFWKIFNLNVLLGLFLMLTLFILSLPIIILMANKSYLIGGILIILAIIIFIPIAILTAYLKIYGYLYAVLGKLKFWASLENAYNLFIKNIWASILMSLIFIPIGIVVMLAILAAIPVLLLVFGLLAALAYFVGGTIAAVGVGIIGFIVFLIYNFFIQSIVQVFAQAIWINFFHEIAKPKVAETVTEKVTEKSEAPTEPLPVIESKK